MCLKMRLGNVMDSRGSPIEPRSLAALNTGGDCGFGGSCLRTGPVRVVTNSAPYIGLIEKFRLIH